MLYFVSTLRTAHPSAVLTQLWTPRQQLELIIQSAQTLGEEGRGGGMPLSRRAQAAVVTAGDQIHPSLCRSRASSSRGSAVQGRTWLGVAAEHPSLFPPRAWSLPTAKWQVLTAGHVQTLTTTFPNWIWPRGDGLVGSALLPDPCSPWGKQQDLTCWPDGSFLVFFLSAGWLLHVPLWCCRASGMVTCQMLLGQTKTEAKASWASHSVCGQSCPQVSPQEPQDDSVRDKYTQWDTALYCDFC